MKFLSSIFFRLLLSLGDFIGLDSLGWDTEEWGGGRGSPHHMVPHVLERYLSPPHICR